MPEIAITRCWIHRDVFECDPNHVCTVYVNGAGSIVDKDAPGAHQVEICDPCMGEINKRRAALGQPPHETAAQHALRMSGEERRA